MGDNFFKTLLGGGGGTNFSNSYAANSNSSSADTSSKYCPFSNFIGSNNNSNNNIQPQPNLNSTTTTPENTRINVVCGSDNKQCSIPKNSSFKDLTSTIKDLFGMHNKSTLCIKYENNNGDMYSVASDCQLKKATENAKSPELRLVVKDLNAAPGKKCESLFSYFFGEKTQPVDSVALNFAATSVTPPAIPSIVPGAVATPEFLKQKPQPQPQPQEQQQANFNNSHTNGHIQHSIHHHGSSHNMNSSIFRPISNSFSPIVNNNSRPSIFYSARDFSTSITTNSINISNSTSTNMNTSSSPLNIHNKLSSSPKLIPSPTSSTTFKTTSNLCKSPPPVINITPTSVPLPTTTVVNKNLQKGIEDDIKMNRNLSFDFNMDLMDDDDKYNNNNNSRNGNNTSPIQNVDAVMIDNTILKEKNTPQCVISPLPVCVEQQKEQVGQCKELASFMGEITKLFVNLRSTNSPNEQSNIKESICSKIHCTLKTMPWILGVFPQLTQFVNQTCPFSVPPNTPPPSPSHISPLLDMTMKNCNTNNFYQSSSIKKVPSSTSLSSMSQNFVNCASVYEINNSVDENSPTFQSQIQLLNKYDQEYNNNNNIINNGTVPQSPSKQLSVPKEMGPAVHKGSKCSLCSHSPIIGQLYRCSNCEKFMFCEFCKNEQVLDQLKCNLPDQPHQIVMITKSTNISACNSSSGSLNNSSGSIDISNSSLNAKEVNNNNSLNNINSSNFLRGCPYQRKQYKCTYNIKFVADITLPLGSVSKPGQNLVKTWKVINNGPTLPSDCLLVRICGNTRLSKIPCISIQNPVPVGESFNISVPFLVPQLPPQCNEYLVGEYWRLCTSDGTYFGDKLWLSLAIRNDNQSTDPILEPFSNLTMNQPNNLKTSCSCGNINCKC